MHNLSVRVQINLHRNKRLSSKRDRLKQPEASLQVINEDKQVSLQVADIWVTETRPLHV